MKIIDESVSPEYQVAAAEIIKSMTFPDIDYQERVIKQVVYRDNDLIQKMKDKVPRLRAFLRWFEDLHMKGRVQPTPPVKPEEIKLIKIK